MFIQIFPYALETVIHPSTTIQDTEQFLMFTGSSLAAQVGIVLLSGAHKKYLDSIK